MMETPDPKGRSGDTTDPLTPLEMTAYLQEIR